MECWLDSRWGSTVSVILLKHYRTTSTTSQTSFYLAFSALTFYLSHSFCNLLMIYLVQQQCKITYNLRNTQMFLIYLTQIFYSPPTGFFASKASLWAERLSPAKRGRLEGVKRLLRREGLYKSNAITV